MTGVFNITNILGKWRFVDKLRAGDQQAWKLLFDENYKSIYRSILVRVSSREVAQDLTSEVLMAIVNYIKDENNKVDNLKAFIHTITRNKIVDYYRSKKREGTNIDLSALAEVLTDNKDIEEKELIGNNLEILSTLEELDDDEKDLILMKYIDGFTAKEIGQVLKINQTNVRVQLHRIIKKIREQKYPNSAP